MASAIQSAVATKTAKFILSRQFVLHDSGIAWTCVARGHWFETAILVDDLLIISFATGVHGRWIPLSFGSALSADDRSHCERNLLANHLDLIQAALMREDQREHEE